MMHMTTKKFVQTEKVLASNRMGEKGGRPKIALVVTSLLIVKFFLIPHIVALSRRYEVTLFVTVDDEALLREMALPATVIHVQIERKESPWRDLLALYRLFVLFRKHRYALVHSISPKGGLLGMLAAWLARVPLRVHTFQGEVWATRTGLWRSILRTLDKLVARLATCITVVSRSERDFLIGEGILPADKSRVLGSGSICGVDQERFRPDAGLRQQVRQELGIPQDALVLLFLGRFNRDKGVFELAQAFSALAEDIPDVRLLMVGPDEEEIFPQVLALCGKRVDRVSRIGFTQIPERYIAAADLLCLPSHREGFGLVIIEAAAAGIPSVCSRIYGITDAVEEGKTGLLFPAGNVSELEQSLAKLLKDADLRESMAVAARARALAMFSKNYVVEEMLAFYNELLPVAKG